MTNRRLSALETEQLYNARLHRLIAMFACVSLAGIYAAYSHPKVLDVNFPPNLAAGGTVRVKDGVAPVPATSVYSFAYYVWQQVNRWQKDGAKDYGKQIYDFQAYITPDCQEQLKADQKKRAETGELRERTRQITEIPGYSFQEARVITEGDAAWTVLLDMHLQETLHGQTVKNTFVRYPVRVVRFDVDRNRNPFQLALDCYGGNQPERIDPQDDAVKSVQDARRRLSPSTLPGVSDVRVPLQSAPEPGAGQAETSPASP